LADLSDKELIKQFREESKRNNAFNLIIRKYQERLYWHIRKIVIGHEDADDVLQNTMIKIWGSLPEFRSDSKIYTWLYRIATNESLTFLKQKKRRALTPWTDVEHMLSEQLESDSRFTGDEIQMKLQKAILKLPPKQRVVFNMKYFDEMKYEEMSQILNTSVGALKASYHHAVKKIESMLDEG